MPHFTIVARILRRFYAPTPLDPNIADNVASLRAIPADQLPDEEARAELIRRAEAGQEVYAYRPVNQPDWVVWIYTYPGEDCRWYPMDWVSTWRAGLSPETPGRRQPR